LQELYCDLGNSSETPLILGFRAVSQRLGIALVAVYSLYIASRYCHRQCVCTACTLPEWFYAPTPMSS